MRSVLVRAVQALTASLVLGGCFSSHDIIMTSPPRELKQETALGPYRKVQRIVDGDTIVVERYGTVRLLGVDTPELHHPTKPVERCAYEAAALTGNLVGNENVRLSMAGAPRDKYGRVLAYVWRDGLLQAKLLGLLQTRLLEAGLAKSYPLPHPRKEAFDAMEAAAKAKKLGIWGVGTCRPVLPEAQ